MAADRDPVRALHALIGQIPDLDERDRQALAGAADQLDSPAQARLAEILDDLERANACSGDQAGTRVIWFGYHFPRNKALKEALPTIVKLIVGVKLTGGIGAGVALLDALKTASEMLTGLDVHGQTLCWVIGERQRRTGRGVTLQEIEAAYSRDSLDPTLVPKLLAELTGKVLRAVDGGGGTWSYQLIT